MGVTQKSKEELLKEISRLKKERDILRKNKSKKSSAEKALTESEEKFKGVVELSADAIITASLDGTILGCNAAALKIFGYSQKQMLSLKLNDLVPHGQGYSLLQFLPEEFAGEKMHPERINKRKDGTLFPTEIHTKIFSIDEEKILIAYIRDITERKTAEVEMHRFNEELQLNKEMLEEKIVQLDNLNEQLTDSEKKLKELNDSKDKFFSIIAHDLRSPFNGLLGFSDFLANEIEDLEKDQIKKFAGEINKAANNLFKLLNNLLDWSRLQIGSMQFQPQKLDLTDIAAEIISLMKSNAIKKNIELINNIKKSTEVYADNNMAHSILRNLVSNAIKFTENGGFVKLSVKDLGKFVEVSVYDNGVGIPEEKIPNIFKIGHYKSTLGTSDEKGSGLGLILCYDFIKLHHGTINCQSVTGDPEKRGTKFYFTLPKSDISFKG